MTPITVDTHVRIIPRAGTVIAVEHTRIKRYKRGNGRYDYTEVPTYLVEFEDGSRARLSAWELEVADDLD